jgi:hypothetical protein
LATPTGTHRFFLLKVTQGQPSLCLITKWQTLGAQYLVILMTFASNQNHVIFIRTTNGKPDSRASI